MNIYIDGDKNAFNSKSAINKFKDYIKNNIKFNLDDLQSRFINYNYKLEIIEKNDNSIKFNIILKELIIKSDKSLLKNKINNLKLNRIKQDDNNLDYLYNKLKKLNLSIPLPSPTDVLNNSTKYKPIIETICKALEKKANNSSNNYIKYFKLLNEKILENESASNNVNQIENEQDSASNNNNQIDSVSNNINHITLNNETDTEEDDN
jgi:hypothetical protein